MDSNEWIEGNMRDRCQKCLLVTPGFVYDEPTTFLQDVEIVHHRNFGALECSAFQGCKLCRLLRLEIINTGVPIQELEDSPGPLVVWRRFYGDNSRGAIQLRLGKSIITKNSLPFYWKSTPEHLVRSARRYDLVGQEQNGRMTILQAKKWLDQCLLNHTGCNTDRQRNRLPTRLIDVGLLEGSEDLRIFIPPDDFSNITRQTDYLTLSYCWGGSQMGHATTVENLGRRCQGFSSEILPKTIRDAIKITRSLGQRYLWVDSLCIIQPIEGNTSDWQFESSQMGQYYQNSFCTISATSATSTSDGCYFQKPGMRFALETCYIGGYVVEDGEANSPRPHGEADLYCVLHPSIPSWDDAVESGTLLTRGWAFQERALSPRILHWTKDAVFWECITLKASEYFPEPMIDDADEDFSLNGLKGMKILSTRNSLKVIRFGNLERHLAKNVLREFWQNQISQYSTKDLTYSSDRLPAISGLAKIVQQYSKYNYLAGLWKSTLLEGLTWHVEEDKNIVRIIPESYVAPSWSWASVKGRIAFAKIPERTEEYWPGPEKRLSHRFLFTVEILHADVTLAGTDATGQISAGGLQLRGLMKSIDFEQCGIQRDAEAESPYYKSLYFDRHKKVKIWLDSSPLPSDVPNTLIFSCLQWYTYHGRASPEVDPEGFQQGSEIGVLLLAPTSLSEREYKRVGWALLHDLEWFGNAAHTTLNII